MTKDKQELYDSLKEVPVEREELFNGVIVHLVRDTVIIPNGAKATREVCLHNGAVCVIPVTAEREVVCVRQYRYAVGQVLLEIPAGKLDTPQEDPREAALRELREETGAVCGRLTDLGVYLGSPALIGETIHMYLAEDLVFGDTDPDEDEFLDIVRIPLADLVELVMAGQVPDGKTQAAVLRAARMLDGVK